MTIDPKKLNEEWPDHLQPEIDMDAEKASVMRDIEDFYSTPDHPIATEEKRELSDSQLVDECLRFPWRTPVAGDDIFGGRFSSPEILDIDLNSPEPSIIALLADGVATATQFPRNTAYLHALGVFSSATVVNFQVQRYDGWMPTGLYTIGAEGSGAGKSRIHRTFNDPVAAALGTRQTLLERIHYQQDKDLEDIAAGLKKAKNPSEINELLSRRRDIKRDIERFPRVLATLKSVTPESAVGDAMRQSGVLNVASDEAEAVNTMLDLAYKDTNKTPANNGILTAAFDGDSYNESRVGRGRSDIERVRGSFAVIAQREIVETLIKAGESGRGVSERFLIIKEKGFVGYRDKRAKRKLDQGLKMEYDKLCESVLNYETHTGQMIRYGDECEGIIEDVEVEIEPLLRPGATYGSEQLKGAASKLTQQALKIAANLHIAKHWKGKSHSMEIEPDTLIKGFQIARQMLESQRQLIDVYSSKSAAKPAIELAALLVGYAKKGERFVKFSRITSAVNKRDWYTRADDKNEFILNMLRRCESLNFCLIKENGSNKSKWNILINPMLCDFNPLKDDK